MGNNEKKVIAFIVEGTSDEAAIGSIMREYFSNELVQFVVVRGDITTREFVNTQNIISKINELIMTLKDKYRYKTSDFIRIIHIVDTDGVFIDDKHVRLADVASIDYYEDHLETKSLKTTLARNHKKAEILYKLHKTGKIGTIPYRIYFNSCNLEHVLYNELKAFTDEEKTEMSDDFAEKYEGDVGAFISFISNPEIAVEGTYQETWRYIEKGLHSLQRHSNMNQIFEHKNQSHDSTP